MQLVRAVKVKGNWPSTPNSRFLTAGRFFCVRTPPVHELVRRVRLFGLSDNHTELCRRFVYFVWLFLASVKYHAFVCVLSEVCMQNISYAALCLVFCFGVWRYCCIAAVCFAFCFCLVLLLCTSSAWIARLIYLLLVGSLYETIQQAVAIRVTFYSAMHVVTTALQHVRDARSHVTILYCSYHIIEPG